MEWFTESDYWLSRWVFQRALALVYLAAFLSAALQFRALLGEHGLLPVPRLLQRKGFRRSPSIFHAYYSDRFFAMIAWSGVVIAGCALVGLTDHVPLAVNMTMWLALWAFYLSIVNVGQAWYSFGWESLLLEVGFLAIFLGAGNTTTPVLVMWLLRWVLFRLEFGAGLIKLRGDRCWRDLTCLYYHHETQPMPGPLSWYFHHLPKPLHRIEVAANHVTQLIVPFGLFAPQPIASGAAVIIVVTQGWLMVSGNFSWLNATAIALALSVIDSAWWARVLPIEQPQTLNALPPWQIGLGILVTGVVSLLSFWPVRNMISHRQLMNYSFTPLHLVNTYGAFGSITRIRHEVIVEGTAATGRLSEAEWKEYEFKGKPGDLRRRPPQISPYHLRLDWLMWFAAISPNYATGWFRHFVRKLLEGDTQVLKLLHSNPFPDEPPIFIRAQLYTYRFTDRHERRETGQWWQRTLVGEYLRPTSLR